MTSTPARFCGHSRTSEHPTGIPKSRQERWKEPLWILHGGRLWSYMEPTNHIQELRPEILFLTRNDVEWLYEIYAKLAGEPAHYPQTVRFLVEELQWLSESEWGELQKNIRTPKAPSKQEKMFWVDFFHNKFTRKRERKLFDTLHEGWGHLQGYVHDLKRSELAALLPFYCMGEPVSLPTWFEVSSATEEKTTSSDPWFIPEYHSGGWFDSGAHKRSIYRQCEDYLTTVMHTEREWLPEGHPRFQEVREITVEDYDPPRGQVTLRYAPREKQDEV